MFKRNQTERSEPNQPSKSELNPAMKVATFALTRGYEGLSKVRYVFVIRRNRALARVFQGSEIEHILFHEANFSWLDQRFVRTFSGLRLKFVDITDTFVPRIDQIPPKGSRRDVGYRLMCRFQYLDVWQYLQNYDYVYRVDEDCIVKSLPKVDPREIFQTGALSEESHEATNVTFFEFLQQQNLSHYYDHKFPYTNCYLTQVSFWLQSNVSDFLSEVGGHPRALVDRWGDLPVLGVALKQFAGWSAEEAVSFEFNYLHLSHNSEVKNGNLVEVQPHFLLKMTRRAACLARQMSGKARP